MSQVKHTYDVNLRLSNGEGAITASAAAQVASAALILDLGAGRVDVRAITDVTALDVASGDEKYEFEFQLSSSASFATVDGIGGILKLGDSTTNGQSADSVIGRYETMFTNEFNGTIYRYCRLYRRIAGTTPSITSTCFLAHINGASGH